MAKKQKKPKPEKPKPRRIPDVTVTPEVDEGPFEADGLSVKQRMFVEAIIGPAQGNATRAAEMAGYRTDNRKSLQAISSENLSKPIIAEAIAHGLARRRATPEWTKTSLVDLASSSMANFVTVDGQGQPRVDFAKAAAAGAIGQIKEYDASTGRIKIHDRTAALGMLLKLHGLLEAVPPAAPESESIRIRAVIRKRPDADPKPD